MLIFEALLLEKRVLFFGGKNTSIQELGEYVQAVAKLISPPMFGILRRIFPYCSLSTQEFLEVYHSFICNDIVLALSLE